MANRVGQKFGNYRLLRFLGEGSFAEVYLGEHLHLGTRAAIKVLCEPLADENVEQFHAEARIIASLVHPNIVRVFDFDIEGNTPFLVMEYAPKGSLQQRHPRGVQLPPDLVIHYVQQIAAALQYAHDQRFAQNRRLIHRDVKPGNMLLGCNGEILLSDFGIAVITHSTDPRSTQEVGGTPPYMAPEQFRGKPVRASDQYALGVAVYTWLSGTFPFHGSGLAIAYQHLSVLPPSLRASVPSLSQEVEQVVLKALAKNPKERFANVQEFASALEQAHMSSKPSNGESLQVGLLSTYHGHTAPVKVVAWSPDGQQMASAGQDKTVQVWNATTGSTIFTSICHEDVVNTVAWSPDGKYIASAGQDKIAQVWDAITGHTIFTHTGHSSSVIALSWSPDGKHIASASQDGTIQIWNARTKITHYSHLNNILAVAWSPDSTYLVSSSLDRTVRVWDVVRGREVSTYLGHTDLVRALAWSPDGEHIASAGNDRTVQVWQASKGRTIVTYRSHGDAVNALAWSPDGQYIASASDDRTVQLWHAATGTHFFTYRHHSNSDSAVAWSPDGTRIAYTSTNHTIQLWQVIRFEGEGKDD